MLRAVPLALIALCLFVTPVAARSKSRPHKPQKPHSHKTYRPPKFQVPPGWPQSISIPEIKVHAKIEHLALSTSAGLRAPYSWGDVGWYSLSARPGAVGHAIMFGHLDSTCCPAVFWYLKDLKRGNSIWIRYKKRALHFRVMWLKNYPDSHLPGKFMYGPSAQRGLILFTCDGVFHYDGTGYDHKLFVYARLVLPNGRLG